MLILLEGEGSPGHALLLAVRFTHITCTLHLAPGNRPGDCPYLHSKNERKCIISSVYSSPLLQVTLGGQIFRLLLVLSDRGGSCQLTIELLSKQRCPPGSWLSRLGGPAKEDVKPDFNLKVLKTFALSACVGCFVSLYNENHNN